MTSEMQGCQWGGIGVEMGDLRREVESIDGVKALFQANKLPMNAALLNYGYFHQSTLDDAECIARAINKSVAVGGVRPEQVDLLILTSADLGFLRGGAEGMPALLARCGLTRALPLAMTAQECAGVLSALDLAWGYVEQGRYANVLVVSHDRAGSDGRRVQPFGILSDATVACMVSSERPLGLALRRFVIRSDLVGMRGNDDFASRKTLISAVTGAVLAPQGMTLGDLGKVFGTNFFRPLSNFNASCIGLTAQQLYIDSAPEVGHCLGADPLLNLAHWLRAQVQATRGGLHLLQAYAPGLQAIMLVEQVGDVTQSDQQAAAGEVVVQSW